MTVYVDDARIPSDIGSRSHLFADHSGELADFTERLGVPHDCGIRHDGMPCRRAWQYLTDAERDRAILFGAIPVSRSVAARFARNRVTERRRRPRPGGEA